MKKKIGLRAVALLLLLVTVTVLLLTACGGNSEEKKPAASTTASSTTKPSGDAQSTTELIRSQYQGYDYNEYEFTILGMESGSWWYSGFMSDTFNEVWYETDSAEPLESSIYTRNRYTEDLLNIKITPVFVDGSAAVAEKLRTALSSGETSYDLAIGSLYDCMMLAQEGHAANLYDIDTLDLSNKWWDQNFVEDFTLFHDRLYTVPGYANVYDDMAVNMLMFNKDMINSMHMESPYTLVHENRWTLDQIASMAKQATYDTGDGTMGPEDNWGLWIGSGGGILQSGFQQPMTALNSEGVPELMLEREDYVNAASRLYEAIFQTSICFDPGAATELRDEMFADNRLLFYWIITCQLNRYRNMDTEFGIVPMPKLDSAQENYSGSVNQHFFSSYLVPSFNSDLDRTGVIMEVMGGFSTDTVYETLFDTMLGYDSKLLRDNDSKEMLDIIFSTKLYSYNLIGLGDGIGKVYSMEEWGSFMYESVLDTYKRGANAALKKIINNFEALQ